MHPPPNWNPNVANQRQLLQKQEEEKTTLLRFSNQVAPPQHSLEFSIGLKVQAIFPARALAADCAAACI